MSSKHMQESECTSSRHHHDDMVEGAVVDRLACCLKQLPECPLQWVHKMSTSHSLKLLLV